MNTQPETMRLADWLDGHSNGPMDNKHNAAAELRRLHAANQVQRMDIGHLHALNHELLKALKVMVRDMQAVNAGGQYGIELEPALHQAQAAIDKAEGQQ